MAAISAPEPAEDDKPPTQFDDELVGLDPDDPEARAFAAHLDRQQQVRSGYTVEGYLSDVSDFADSANRLGGHYKLMAGILVLLILLGVTITAWDAILFVVATFTR